LDIVSGQWGELFAQLAKPLEEAQQRGAIRKDADIQMILVSLASTMLTLTIYLRRKADRRHCRAPCEAGDSRHETIASTVDSSRR
jgi:hypothetical protein